MYPIESAPLPGSSLRVHIVRAQAGEYSDRTEWTVAAYLDEAKAKEHIEKASARAREWELLDDDEREKHIAFKHWPVLPKWSTFDAQFQDRTRYYLESLQLITS